MSFKNPVFIHGWSFSSHIFSTLPGIKIDLPSHGRNRKCYENFERMIIDIGLSLPSVHDVIGWSLGGSVALLLALTFPKKVRRLILIGTSPFFGGAWSVKNLRAFRMMIRRKGVEAFRKMAYRKDFECWLDKEGAMRMLEDYINLDLRDRLPLLKKEVLIVQGEDDVVVPVTEAFKLYNLIRGSKLIILPGGHFPAENEVGLLFKVLKIS